MKESGDGPRNSAMGVPLVQSDGRRSSDPNLVIDLDEKAKLTDHPFKRPEKPMIDVAPGSPKRGRASVAEREAAKREIEMGLEMGRLRLEEDNTGMVFCVQMDTNQRRYDLDPMQHGICLPDANDVFEDGFKTIKRGATARDLVKDHATKQKREMRRQNSVYALHFHHRVCVKEGQGGGNLAIAGSLRIMVIGPRYYEMLSILDIKIYFHADVVLPNDDDVAHRQLEDRAAAFLASLK